MGAWIPASAGMRVAASGLFQITSEAELKVNRRRGIARLAFVSVILLITVTALSAATVEERLDQINRLPEKARNEGLEQEARKEGELVWYAAMASDRAGELIKLFENKHPFLKVRFQPGGATRQLEQLLVEHRAKKHRADIINTRRSFVGVMAKAGAIARYRTPLRTALREGFTDREGLVNGIYAQPRVFLFNTRMVPRERAPAVVRGSPRSAVERQNGHGYDGLRLARFAHRFLWTG